MTTGMLSGSQFKVDLEIFSSILKDFPRAGTLTKIEYISLRARYKKINITQPKSPYSIRKTNNISSVPFSSTTIMTSNSGEYSMLTTTMTLMTEIILIHF